MKIKTNIKAGGMNLNHNQTSVRLAKRSGLRVKTSVKAGMGTIGTAPLNHNETLVRKQSKRNGLKVRTSIKAGMGTIGGSPLNHNETLVRRQTKCRGLKVKTSIKAGLGV